MAKQIKELKLNMPLAEWLSHNTKEELVQMADLMGLGVPDSDSARKDELELRQTGAVGHGYTELVLDNDAALVVICLKSWLLFS